MVLHIRAQRAGHVRASPGGTSARAPEACSRTRILSLLSLLSHPNPIAATMLAMGGALQTVMYHSLIASS